MECRGYSSRDIRRDGGDGFPVFRSAAVVFSDEVAHVRHANVRVAGVEKLIKLESFYAAELLSYAIEYLTRHRSSSVMPPATQSDCPVSTGV